MRDKTISFRVTANEKNSIASEAARLEMRTGEYLRFLHDENLRALAGGMYYEEEDVVAFMERIGSVD
jgi:hypothetical protein